MIIILLLALISFSFAQDTLIYWEPEQRVTYDSIGQVDCRVWACDSFVHILVNYDFPAMYLRSSDYGQTWSDTMRLSIMHSNHLQTLIQQDSVVYFVWSEQRAGPPGIAQVDTSYAFFRRSNDCGMTLDSAIFLGKGCPVSIDAKKETLFVDPVVWDPPPVWGPYLIYSFDGGFNWSAYLPIIDSAGQPNIAYRNGILHFAGCRDYKIIYTRSTNIGNTWSTPTIITAPNTVLPKKPNLALGPNQDLYIAWTDNKFGGGMQFDDVMFRKSTDDGLTWGPEQRLTPDSKCQAGGALDMVSQDSIIFIVWDYNGTGVPAPCSLFFLASTACGETWRLREGVAGGEGYALNDANVAVAQNFVYVVWRDPHPLIGAPPELYIRRGSFTPPGIEERTPVSVSSVNVYPNPFREKIQIRYMMQDTGYKIRDLFIKIFNVLGKEVIYEVKWNKVKDETVKIDTKSLPSGVYFVCIEVGNERVFKKAVKLK